VSTVFLPKGSLKNKLAILGVESPVLQGLKMQGHIGNMPNVYNAAGQEESPTQM